MTSPRQPVWTAARPAPEGAEQDLIGGERPMSGRPVRVVARLRETGFLSHPEAVAAGPGLSRHGHTDLAAGELGRLHQLRHVQAGGLACSSTRRIALAQPRAASPFVRERGTATRPAAVPAPRPCPGGRCRRPSRSIRGSRGRGRPVRGSAPARRRSGRRPRSCGISRPVAATNFGGPRSGPGSRWCGRAAARPGRQGSPAGRAAAWSRRSMGSERTERGV